MNARETMRLVDGVWDDSIVPELVEYIRIPNKSPAFDPAWFEHGYMDEAVELIANWCNAHAVAGMGLEVVRLDGRTPLLFIEIPGHCDETVLLYGHLDKQPEMTGWRDNLGPWTPVIESDRLYGRGGADDGYAAFASLTAIRSLREQSVPHPRCVILIEGCEESGSYDLPHYVDALADRIGAPGLVVCLDSGCGNYDQLWCTTSLRGLVTGNLVVQVLKEGVHSGDASGVVPSSFRILRLLLSRIEDQHTGEILPPEFHVAIPLSRTAQAAAAAMVLGDAVFDKFPFEEGVGPIDGEPTELILNRTWRPALSITGADGLPPLDNAGNVTRPFTAARISLRIPPTLDDRAAVGHLKAILEADPPYGAVVTFHAETSGPGWNAPELSAWLVESIEGASRAYFGREAVLMGEGGSIPFMGMLGEKFPNAQFLVTGVLGPHSNAHGPNEFLDIPTGKKLTCCVAQIIADYFQVTK